MYSRTASIRMLIRQAMPPCRSTGAKVLRCRCVARAIPSARVALLHHHRPRRPAPAVPPIRVLNARARVPVLPRPRRRHCRGPPQPNSRLKDSRTRNAPAQASGVSGCGWRLALVALRCGGWRWLVERSGAMAGQLSRAPRATRATQRRDSRRGAEGAGERSAGAQATTHHAPRRRRSKKERGGQGADKATAGASIGQRSTMPL